jgi:hypothetical protein
MNHKGENKWKGKDSALYMGTTIASGSTVELQDYRKKPSIKKAEPLLTLP